MRPAVGATRPADLWVAENAAASFALLAYGLWTRYRSLAAAGQALLLLVSVVGCVLRVWLNHPAGDSLSDEMALTLVPLVVLLATIYAGRRNASGAALTGILAVYEGTAALFLLGWGFKYIPASAQFSFFAVTGALVSVWAQVRRVPRWFWWSGLVICAGLCTLALLGTPKRASFLHLLGIAAIVGQQRFAANRKKRDPAAAPVAPAQWQAASMIAATLCAWVVLNARVTLSFDATFTLAAAWSLFAALVFAAGLILREKVYRWMGLAILVCTLARIGLVDIWQLDGLGRAVSAFCLGLVLLGVGYLYNRFQARWHGLF